MITQIAVIAGDTSDTLYALDDKGKIFYCYPQNKEIQWRQLPTLPSKNNDYINMDLAMKGYE